MEKKVTGVITSLFDYDSKELLCNGKLMLVLSCLLSWQFKLHLLTKDVLKGKHFDFL